MAARDGCQDPACVLRSAAATATLAALDSEVASCRACPRLVEWREQVASNRRASFADQTYWGRPVPGFGPPDAEIMVLGLAPAAHGGNRTGRVFTGDRSGDFLFAALHRAGLANQPEATGLDDGLELHRTRVGAAVRCAPPANKPTPLERDTCRPWLVRELELVAPTLRVVVLLGGFAWQALWSALAQAGWAVPKPRPRFGHGVAVQLAGRVSAAMPGGPAPGPPGLVLLGCYHPSQQNTFTGRLTPAMIDGVLQEALRRAGKP